VIAELTEPLRRSVFQIFKIAKWFPFGYLVLLADLINQPRHRRASIYKEVRFFRSLYKPIDGVLSGGPLFHIIPKRYTAVIVTPP